MKYKLTIPGLLPGLNEYIDAERSHKGKYKAASMKRQAQNVIGYMIQMCIRDRSERYEVPPLKLTGGRKNGTAPA